MKIKTFVSNSPEETIRFASQWGAKLAAGSVVVLSGNLGSGKTIFVKGAAKGAGVKETVTSPTFVFVNVYRGKIPVYHLDLYRVDSPKQADSIGYEEYFDAGGIVFMEWGERVKPALPSKAIRISFEVLGEEKRRITIRRPKK